VNLRDRTVVNVEMAKIHVVIKSEFSKFPKKSLTWLLSSFRC
jgi:hypothetical protein